MHRLLPTLLCFLMLPVSACGAPLVDTAIAFLVLLVVMLLYGVTLSWQLIMIPLFLISVIISALGVGLLMASLIVSYRDFRHVLPFLLRVWFFITPVIMPVSFLPETWRGIPVHTLLYLNPMAGTIEGFRAIVLGAEVDYNKWLLSLAVGMGAMVLGMFYFTRAERQFADIA